MPRYATPLCGTIVAACAMVAAPAPAWAQSRPVAVIDATGDPDGIALARAIQAELALAGDLAPLPDREALALVGALDDEDADDVAAAQRALADARDAVAHFDRPTALGHSAQGQARLLTATPTRDNVSLLADIMFVEGLAHAADRDLTAAIESFAAVRRLDPARHIDPHKYLPDVVHAFEAAGRGNLDHGSVAVAADGLVDEIWIDGARAGRPPVVLSLPAGVHFVAATGADIRSAGVRVSIFRDRNTRVSLVSPPADPRLRLERIRRRLLAAPDDAARAVAIASLATAVAVADVAIVVRAANGKLGVRVWRNQAPGLGPVRFLDGVTPRDVLGPLVARPKPVAAPPPRPLRPRPRPAPEPRAWWRERWAQAGMVGGALAVIAGVAFVIAVNDPGSTRLGGVVVE